MVGLVGGKVTLAGTVSGSAAEMHTAAGRVRCIHSLEVAAGSRKRAIGVQRSSVATGEDMARCLAAHTDYTMAEARLETHMMLAAGPRREHVAVADKVRRAHKARKAHTAIDRAGRLVGRTDCTGSASWL